MIERDQLATKDVGGGIAAVESINRDDLREAVAVDITGGELRKRITKHDRRLGGRLKAIDRKR